MRTLFMSFLVVILLAACSGGSAVGKQMAGSDSLVINFNTPNSNTIEKTTYTTENKAIKKLAHFVDGKAGEAYKCGYDGNLMFYKKGSLVADVSFNYSGDGCHHFITEIEGNLSPTVMSNEAADFLKSMSEGKSFY
jgi:hypothetical protein